MLKKVIATQFGVDGEFIAPIELLVEPHGCRVNIGLWANKAAFDAGAQMLEKKTFFLGGDDNPFPLSENQVRNKLKQALRTLPELADAEDEE